MFVLEDFLKRAEKSKIGYPIFTGIPTFMFSYDPFIDKLKRSFAGEKPLPFKMNNGLYRRENDLSEYSTSNIEECMYILSESAKNKIPKYVILDNNVFWVYLDTEIIPPSELYETITISDPRGVFLEYLKIKFPEKSYITKKATSTSEIKYKDRHGKIKEISLKEEEKENIIDNVEGMLEFTRENVLTPRFRIPFFRKDFVLETKKGKISFSKIEDDPNRYVNSLFRLFHPSISGSMLDSFIIGDIKKKEEIPYKIGNI